MHFAWALNQKLIAPFVDAELSIFRARSLELTLPARWRTSALSKRI